MCPFTLLNEDGRDFATSTLKPLPLSSLFSTLQIMDQSLIAMGAPSDRLFCSTSFVRKPTRYDLRTALCFFIVLNRHPLRYRSLTSASIKLHCRSKYCALTGFVIARMDHHCVWLNNSVGFGNHRVFMLFLAAQLGATAVFAVMISR